MEKNGGILLAGGKGTRLYPNTKIINKHLMPIYDKPMIFYSLSIFMLSKIRDITVVCNPSDELAYKKLLGNGEQFGINITYSKQEQPDGIPDAINSAQMISNYEKFMVVLGDNFLYGRDFYNILSSNIENHLNAAIYYQKVKDPSPYGVIKWENKKVIDLIEKPTEHVSNDAVIGLYIFDNKFSKYFDNLKKSRRNEYEIVDIIKSYGLDKVTSNYIGRGTAWFDMGSSEDFFNSSQFVKTIQDRQGLLVCSPHEIAFRNNWIDLEEIKSYLKEVDGSEYAENLSKTLETN
jgi:glucose-1-phosphate thymidylyltransferase